MVGKPSTIRQDTPDPFSVDRTMPLVALAAMGIVCTALIAAILSWHALVGRGPPRGGEAVGAALAPAGRSLVIDSLRDGGAAMRAGLRVGDLIESVDGAPVASVAAANRALAAPAVDIRVRRADKALDIHLDARERPPLG